MPYILILKNGDVDVDVDVDVDARRGEHVRDVSGPRGRIRDRPGGPQERQLVAGHRLFDHGAGPGHRLRSAGLGDRGVGLSRQREFRADAGAAALMGSPDAMVSALRVLGGVGQSHLPSNMRAFGIAGGGVRKLFSTHPPIHERLEALRSAQR